MLLYDDILNHNLGHSVSFNNNSFIEKVSNRKFKIAI